MSATTTCEDCGGTYIDAKSPNECPICAYVDSVERRVADADKDARLSAASARVVEAAVESRARWGRNVTIDDLRVIGLDEDTLTLFAAVDALIAERQR